jgi:chemotaxis protein methyltransferase CheR
MATDLSLCPGGTPTEIDPDSYKFLCDYVYDASGIVLDGDKQYLVEARLTPVIHQKRLSNLKDLCALLKTAGGVPLKQQVVDAMTTNETYFFRDNPQYEALKSSVLPALLEDRAAARSLNFWSAASSSGQEAYSLAMMLLEMGLGNWNIKILGTDLSSQILERARLGRYLQIEVNRGLPATYLVKYFNRVGMEWQIKDQVRKMVEFRPLDLRQSMRTLGPFDVVFCRNVLIYFDVKAKKQILREIHGTLNRGGYLLLGGSENALQLENRFEMKSFGRCVFYQAQ